jgi:hypothetical protein
MASNAVFKPTNKTELQGAVHAWIQHPTNAAIEYGPINAWDIPR